MEQVTGDLAGKLASGGLFTAVGAVVGAFVNAWVARRKDKGEQSVKHEESALNAIVAGNRQLMDSLLQTTKQLDEQLRKTREELAECETKHRDADRRLAQLERTVKTRTTTTS